MKLASWMETIFVALARCFAASHRRGSHPQSKQRSCGTFRQQSTQTKRAFKHTDRRFYAVQNRCNCLTAFSLVHFSFSLSRSQNRPSKLKYVLHSSSSGPPQVPWAACREGFACRSREAVPCLGNEAGSFQLQPDGQGANQSAKLK